MFAVVLDTCVLWPSLQRDSLLSLAIENLYRPLWSAAILAELEYHEASMLVDRGADPAVAAGQARYLIDQMTSVFDDALVEGWEPLDGTFGLPDPDDEHLVAAAVIGGAGAMVTDNIRDLPRPRFRAISTSSRRPPSRPTPSQSHQTVHSKRFQRWPSDTSIHHTQSTNCYPFSKTATA